MAKEKSKKPCPTASIKNERHRQQLLRLMDGRQDLYFLIYHLANLVHSEVVCQWLLDNGLKGALLAEWNQEKFKGSFVFMVQFIVAKVNRAGQLKPLKVGEHYQRQSSQTPTLPAKPKN